MLKLAGCMLIMAAGVGIADRYYTNFKMRCDELRNLEEMAFLLQTEICVCKNPLPEALRMASEKLKEPFKGFLLSVREELLKYEEYRVSVIWERKAEESMKRLHFKEEDKELFIDLGRAIEQEHKGMHKERLLLSRERLHKSLLEAEGERKDKKRLYYSLGTMGGLFFIIMLI